jgi:photosystem II stability/assembly factor-like uncharacterized protein
MSRRRLLLIVTVLLPGAAWRAPAQTTSTSAPTQSAPTSAPSEKELLSADTFAGLALRSIGPALMSGRISDLAVNPQDRHQWYVAAASGGVWKTTNGGTTWTPIFDAQGSYSIGCLALDPKNPAVLWVGTGENNSQRSVGFGDGVYRTRDAGVTWENLGLKDSEHIGMIRIDPRDSDVVYVAAQGPLWRTGPERGLYKTTNGGKTWLPILQISENTGVNEVHLDPRNPDVLYASAYQRRRHVWTLIDGGPESAIYKSTDAGVTWRKLTKGLPEVDLGRIGLAISPANPDVVYAIVEAADGKGGFFRSADCGETWERRSDYRTFSAQYYNELVCDPRDVDHVYAVDTFLHETRDGGKTMQRVIRENRHVDDHALWLDPQDPHHMLVGCDGGLYESFDRGDTWGFKANLPVTQFYRVSADTSLPFYFVYGGTQDNNTVGGPSRTRDHIGIASEHWFVTVGGDGFKTQVDPEDPNIIYSQWQYAGLVRHDRRTGETVDIRPRPAPGEEPLRWNWDSPLIISPHNHRRLYFGANRLFRSDDGGDSWTAISGDLTRHIDRNTLKVMGKLQSADAVAKSDSTSYFGNTVTLSESPLVEGLIYVGTDDGLVQVTEDGGQNWRKQAEFPGVPEMTYVSRVLASQHDAHTVYAAFDNHKNGDFKPYVLRSPDRGRTWVSIAGDLPPRNIVYALAEDHVNPQLLFVGTEFGVYFTTMGGTKWIRLRGGLPTIAVKDIEVQRRENDLVLATFGRGIYILDDYTPLRSVSLERLKEDVWLLPVKDTLRYVEMNRLGGSAGKGSQGDAFFAAPNPPFGAVFTYYLKEKVMTRKERRQEAEKKAAKEGRAVPYPTLEDLRAEDEEKEPAIVLIVQDESRATIRRLTAPRDKGFHRVAWDLRYPTSTPTEVQPPPDRPPWEPAPEGPLAPAGIYTVTLAREVDGVVTPLAGPQELSVVPLEAAMAAAQAQGDWQAFRQRIARLQRAVQGALQAATEAGTRIKYVRKAIVDTPGADPELLIEAQRLEQRLNELLTKLRGDATRAKRNEPAAPSILERVDDVVGSQWNATTGPTQTQRDAYRYAGGEFAGVLADLHALIEKDLAQLEARLEAAGAPWTPGRIPTWRMEEE